VSRGTVVALALVAIVASTVGIVLSLVAILGGDDDSKPAHDPDLWQRAKVSAGYYCSLEGIGGGDADAIYTEEFRACVEDRTPIEYRRLEAERAG